MEARAAEQTQQADPGVAAERGRRASSPTSAARLLALQRAAGNRTVRRLLQRDVPVDQVDLTGSPNVYMLRPPPKRTQNALTCWAASLSSWLSVLGVQQISTDEILGRYIGTSCIDGDNALPLATAEEVYAEWAVKFEFFVPSDGKPTGAQWRERLRKHGHLLLAKTGTGIGHVVVVYGSGFDDQGMPSSDWISVMDPLVGGHRNIRADSLPSTFAIGHLGTKRTRPAACMSRPFEPPPEEAPAP